MTDSFPRLSPEPLPAGSRIACRVEYNGSRFNGWQIQPDPDVPTVQAALEAALFAVAAAPVRVHCAGRTDTGVHGHAQVIHFDAPASRSPKAWVMGGNGNLPLDVRLHWAQAVPEEFHARFSALSRRYRYVIVNTPIRPALLPGLVTWQRFPLDAAVMHREAQCMLGERDFSAFRAASCQSTTPMRNVQEVAVERRGDFVVIEIRANAFLHHMVRNIAGSLMAVGSGRQQAGWIAELLEGRDRTKAADTAPPDGLYLAEIEYPDHYQLPPTPYGPALL
ncbi:tRNA pseudouridine(38-40) synthase TruA [Haliea sp. E17]|uniref:tRNA pseudouridine(38-40) synthase TruA n=1 Tax=Haliea sp. E17 TaxID=3401576 RepID=UPI003AAE2021